VSRWAVSVDVGAVTRADIVRYAGASGDLNPIHYDNEYAVSAGAGGVFAMGMYPVGLAARVLAEHFGPGSIRRLKARFEQRVWPGDHLVIEAREVGRSGEELQIELEVWRGEGSRAARCWATVQHNEDKDLDA